MISINALNGGNMSIVTGTPGPAGHPETRVTYFGGETDTFNIEGELKNHSPEDRKRERLNRKKPALVTFWSWLDTLTPLSRSNLSKAVIYAKNQKPYKENYLLDGR